MVKRGDIYYADLSPVYGSEQGGVRPVVVIQNNKGNAFSSTVIVAAVTSNIKKIFFPTHVLIDAGTGLNKPSIVLLEQIRTIDKSRLAEKIGSINAVQMHKIDRAIELSLGLGK